MVINCISGLIWSSGNVLLFSSKIKQFCTPPMPCFILLFVLFALFIFSFNKWLVPFLYDFIIDANAISMSVFSKSSVNQTCLFSKIISIHVFSKFSKNEMNSPSFSFEIIKSMYVFLPTVMIPCFELHVGDCM